MGRKLKVMYVIGSMEVGGAERHLLEVIRHLDRSRFEPVLCCISGSGALEPAFRQTGIKIGVFAFKGIRKRLSFLWELWRIFSFVLRERPDVVHAYLYWANILGGLFGFLARRPVIITSRRGMGGYKDTLPLLQNLENMINRVTDIVTVNSLGVKADVLKREQIDPAKIRLIYNGVHDRFAAGALPQSEVVRAEIGLRPGSKVIGCVANVRWYKGYAELIEAFAKVHSAFPDTQLVCVGQDSGIVAELIVKAEQLGCADDLFFVGSRSDVEVILPLFDIQVLPSHEEGFSNAVLEGMAAGNPMVVTDVGGNAEAVHHGVHGLVVPPKDAPALADALLSLLARPEAARHMGTQAQQRARTEFTVPAMIEKMQELYLEQMRRKRPRHPLVRESAAVKAT